MGAMFSLHYYILPAWKKTANCLVGGWLMAVTVSCLSQFVGSIVGHSVVPFVVCCAVIIPAWIAGFGFILMRLRHWERFVRQNTVDLKLGKPDDAILMVRRLFNIDSAAAAVYLPRALEILSRAKEAYPRDARLHFEQALLTYFIDHDAMGAIIHLKAAKRLPAAFDVRFLVSSLYQVVQNATHDAERKEEVEIRLGTASKHHKMCRAFNARFWQLLVRSHSDSVDTQHLLELVRNGAHHQSISAAILQDLLRENPNNVSYVQGHRRHCTNINSSVLRAWAHHLLELRNDKEGAESVLVMADQFEEEQSKSHTKPKRQQAEHDQYSISVDIPPVLRPSPRRIRFNEDGACTQVEKPDTTIVRCDSESEMSMRSSASAGQLDSDTNAHARAVRRKIETARSTVLMRLHLAVLTTLAALIAGSVVNYSVSVTTMSQFQGTLRDMAKTVATRTYSTSAVMKIREYETALMAGNSTLASAHCSSAIAQINTFQSVFNDMFKASDSFSEVAEFWRLPSVDVRLIAYSRLTVRSAAWDAGYMFVNTLRSVCNMSLESTGMENFRGTHEFRFVMENGPTVFISTLRTLASLYADMSASQARKIQYFLYGFYPGTLVSAILVATLVYYPAIRRLRSERNSAIRLFLDIPKSTLINTFERLALKNEDEDPSGGVSRNRTSLTPSRKMNIVYGLNVLFTVSMCTAVFATSISFTVNNMNSGMSMAYGGVRKNTVTEMLLWSNELIVGDTTMWSRASLVAHFADALQRFKTADRVLKYGDPAQGIKSRIISDSSLYSLWYNKPCPEDLHISECKGLGLFLRSYVDSLEVLAGLYTEIVNTTESPTTLLVHKYYDLPYAARDPLDSWLDTDLEFEQKSIESDESRASSIITALFWVSMPVTILLYLLVRYFVVMVGDETQQVFKMLMFLPMNVIDSVQSIHDYLEMGKSASEIEELSEKEQERVTKSIVDACEDIVILCNKDRAIDVFNPVAETVTGYTAADAIGKNISIVIPEDVEANLKLLNSIFRFSHYLWSILTSTFNQRGEKLASKKISTEVVVRTKDGGKFSSLVSVSRTVVHSKVTTALFIRDITAIKERELQIIHERNRAEELLLNIFPRQVAEKFKAAEGISPQLAEASVFEEVSVLFADICGFTTMSSNMTAQHIVEMLNGVFSLWDNALDVYGVEKIKTIGDAYMVVSGVPETCADHADRMLRFAVAMLGNLNDYRQQTSMGLSIRIGINAGPVVAGIIGTRKIAYDLWGDTVNVASRMEHSGLPGTIQVTEAMFRRHYAKHGQHFVCRGALAIQGKGDIVCYNCNPPVDVLDRWKDFTESRAAGAPFEIEGAGQDRIAARASLLQEQSSAV